MGGASDKGRRSHAASQANLVTLGELWRIEREEVRSRFQEERRGLSLAERVARGTALRDLSLRDSAAAPGGRTLLWLAPLRPEELEESRIGVGDPVRLWWDDPDSLEAVRATVSRRGGGRIAVVIDGDIPERIETGRFALDRDEPEATFDRGDRALSRLRDADDASDEGRLRSLLFPSTAGTPPRLISGAPTPTPPRLISGASTPDAGHPFDQGLNPPQLEAVARALAAPVLALIHGPPGTGKTRTLVEVIRRAAARGERILATAASNTAVDNLGERLVAAGIDVVRLGHPARVAPALEGHTLDARLETTEAWALARRWMAEAWQLRRRADSRRERSRGPSESVRDLLHEARQLQRDARRHLAAEQEAILARTQVVCATAAGADHALLGAARFDRVVLDEATQAPDPIALVALLRAPRAVLAGDPCQLPPTVISLDAAARGLATTIFERLADQAVLLEVQHRMHATLMAFPSRSLYGGRLVAAPEVARHRLEDLGIAGDPIRPGPFVFLDTAGKGWTEVRAGDDPSTSNPAQAERTAAEVRRLLSRGLPPGDAALITPYEAHARLLREALAPERAAGLEIGTVDGFQGREKEAIVVDLVRSNGDGEIGFLADTRRMNVALTRARRFLLVVGDSSTLASHPYYRAFLDAAEEAGAWVSAWSDDAPPL